MTGGNVELPFGGEMEPTDSAAPLLQGVAFDVIRVPERQDAIDDILSHRRWSPERRVKELNTKINGEWDDELGISYTGIEGEELPGLTIHGVAEKLALSACDVTDGNFEGANLNAAVMTAVAFRRLRARHANMDHTVSPLSSFEGADLEDVTAIEGNFVFGDLSDVKARGLTLTSGYLFGTKGLERIIEDVADIRTARVLLQAAGVTDPSETLREALADRFMGVPAAHIERQVSPVRVIRQVNAANTLPDEKRLAGAVLDDVILAGAGLHARIMTGSIWHKVRARGLEFRGSRAAGSVILDSDLQDIDATGLWVPGMFAANTSFRNSDMTRGNMAGAVFYNCDMTNVDTERTNVDGIVVIGGRPPEFDEETMKRLKILELGDLPTAVAEIVSRMGALSISGRSTANRELEQ
jgi:uncharacterized protein YjbI with pentapeptide repeats